MLFSLLSRRHSFSWLQCSLLRKKPSGAQGTVIIVLCVSNSKTVKLYTVFLRTIAGCDIQGVNCYLDREEVKEMGIWNERGGWEGGDYSREAISSNILTKGRRLIEGRLGNR